MKDRNTFLEIKGYINMNSESVYDEESRLVIKMTPATEDGNHEEITLSLRGLDQIITIKNQLLIRTHRVYEFIFKNEKGAKKGYAFCHKFLKDNL